RIWSVADGTAVGEVMQHGEVVYSASFSDDDLRVATASGNMARVWEASTGRAITAPLVQGSGRVLSTAFSSDSKRLVTASQDGNARVWDIWYDFENTDELLALLEAISGVNSSADDLAPLSDTEKRRRLDQIRASSRLSNTSFLRWFVTHW